MPPSTLRVVRFDVAERVAHWGTAILFLVLIATALPLYFAPIEAVVGRRALVAHIHLWAGVALPIPLLVSVVGPWGRRLRRDIRRVNLWSPAEVRWLTTLGRRRFRVTDKFNPGQKLNTLFIAAAIVVMLGTGLMMQWYGLVAIDLRTGATFVHDLMATALVVVIVAHVAVALGHRDALRSIFKGTISEGWAEEHAATWLAELNEEPSPVSPH